MEQFTWNWWNRFARHGVHVIHFVTHIYYYFIVVVVGWLIWLFIVKLQHVVTMSEKKAFFFIFYYLVKSEIFLAQLNPHACFIYVCRILYFKLILLLINNYKLPWKYGSYTAAGKMPAAQYTMTMQSALEFNLDTRAIHI